MYQQAGEHIRMAAMLYVVRVIMIYNDNDNFNNSFSTAIIAHLCILKIKVTDKVFKKIGNVLFLIYILI